jgi:negative regulator of sigma E activity
MTEDRCETLSAFVDGEVAGDEEARILDGVLADESLTRRWVSYHLIGDAIRQHAHFRRGAEPESVTVDGAGARTIKPAPAIITPVGGLALAASVALVAILGIHALSPKDTGVAQTTIAGGAPVVGAATAVAGGGPAADEGTLTIPAHRVTAAASSMRQLARQTWSDAAPDVATRLNGYLVTHNEHLANGLHGMHPYARIVAYDGRGN